MFSGIKFTFCKTLFTAAFILVSCSLLAQTFPPPGSCTSKDLELVGAALPGVAPCNSCVSGSQVTRTLYLTINNKTGSTRTSFAYWGTLEVYNDDGTLDSLHSGPFSGCVGPIPANTTTSVPNTSITYICGQSLKLINLYLAWTDASPNSTCATLLGSTSTINPKCGTLPELSINAGVNAIAAVTDATCTSNGSILVTPNGGTPPYSVTIGPVNFSNVTTSADFPNLSPGNYTVTVTDANGCTVTKVRTVTMVSVTPPSPVSGGDQTVCALTPLQTLTATATGSSVTWYDAAINGNLVASPVWNAVGTVTYYAQSAVGTCVSARTPVSLTINPTPAVPVSGGNQVVCELSPIQTLTAAATGTSVTWYDASSNGNLIVNPILSSVGTVTYYAQSTLGSCSSERTAVSLTINATPAAPVSGGNQVQCEQSPIQTLTATATGVSVSWYTASSGGSLVANPVWSAVGSKTYYAQSKLGTCKSLTRTPVKLTINPTPAQPVSGGDQAECKQTPIQTLTATATGPNVTWYNALTGGTLIANPILHSVGTKVFYAQSRLGSCKSFVRTPVSLTIHPNPASPVVCIVQPSLCGPVTGSITFISPLGPGLLYTINGGNSWQAGTVFDNLTPGSVTGIQVNDQNGCFSGTVNCDASDCSQTAGRVHVSSEEITGTETNASNERPGAYDTNSSILRHEAQVSVYPNPFTDKVKFEVVVPQSGNGTLEVFNLFGQRVKTIFSGYFPSGINSYEMNLENLDQSNFIYQLTMDKNQVKGKFSRINR